MNAVEIEESISELVMQEFDRTAFPYQLLESFGNKETTLKRLRKGNSNRTDVEGAVLQRSNIHILATEKGCVEEGLKALRKSPKTAKQKAKFILATDGIELQAEDINSGEVIACAYENLPEHFGFLLPLAGITTVNEIKNNAIDIKATGRLDKLYVALLQENPDWDQQENREAFNHFMAQLIFCFFAEDTRIFNGDNLFTATIQQMSESDGSNTQEIISNIFTAMDMDPRKSKRKGVRPYADVFPYVNGGLFGTKPGYDLRVPKFSKMARTYLLRAGDLDWTAINPDIFGSMIQAVADEDERGELGMHYTSVPNILKVLNPLFLDSLREDLSNAGDSKIKLLNLRKRIAHIRVFDPACGSGNFLVIAYKHMRAIENELNDRRKEKGRKSDIPLTNFRGIEIKSFAAEIARLALIIAEYQCDELYIGQREALALFLPLNEQNWITRGNALRLDWLSICPPTGETKTKIWSDDMFGAPLEQTQIDFENEGGETYICGNPPYLGGKWQSSEQKNDLRQIFDGRTKKWKSLDYVAGWFMKGADYLTHTDGVCAFVSTNSICQGQQVPILWPRIFELNNEIVFAHTSFKWANLATHNAGVIVVIVGISARKPREKILFQLNNDNIVTERKTPNINAYLVGGPSVFVEPSRQSKWPETPMVFGNMPRDGGGLIIEDKSVVQRAPATVKKFIKRYVGSADFIRSNERYCLWIEDKDVADAYSCPFIVDRLSRVREIRHKSNATSTKEYSQKPHRFVQIAGTAKRHSLIIPRVSSESRAYLPVGILDQNAIISDSAFAIYDGPIWHLAIIASKLHLAWIAAVCGKLKTDYRYSNTLGWNTFPIPKLTTLNKAELTLAAENILLARENHFPASVSDLYKPNLIPENLLRAHQDSDRILEEIYIGRRFKNNTERLEYLFEEYAGSH